jgi:hypothetical protein
MSDTQKTITIHEIGRGMTETTLRSTARQAVIKSVSEAAAYDHQRNYHKLHIDRDGDVRWTEHINQSDDIIDSGADHFAAIPSVAVAGTGSICCNCDYCDEVYYAEDEQLAKDQGRDYDRDAKYADEGEAIADAVANSDLSGLEADMLAEFDAIPAGYFNDEEEEEPNASDARQ